MADMAMEVATHDECDHGQLQPQRGNRVERYSFAQQDCGWGWAEGPELSHLPPKTYKADDAQVFGCSSQQKGTIQIL